MLEKGGFLSLRVAPAELFTNTCDGSGSTGLLDEVKQRSRQHHDMSCAIIWNLQMAEITKYNSR